ncbi:MAG: serine protease [Cytophaga sp.]|uniref:serine protease n=1 Tax=Cytophaga sp. TaxID=29535 RepID=UPI003F814602
MEYFDSLDPLLRVFWYIALPASVIFLIQTIMTFFGGDTADGLDADFDGDLEDGDSHFQLFSFRNLINFLLGFSWTGISFYNSINHTLLIVLSVAVGALFVYMFFAIIRELQKLAEDNSFSYEETLNKSAEVYLTIPGGKSGRGKILVSVNGSMHELDAMTENDVKIPSGSTVKIVKILNENILLVETL